MGSAIDERRSIRKFKDTPVSENDILEILKSGIAAPSSKNGQPWRYTVVRGSQKAEMIKAFREGIAREQRDPLLPKNRDNAQYAEYTVRVMEQAPVVIFVENTLGKSVREPATPEERVAEICNVQSIGAAIENMCLRATELGLGSLWICDLFFAYQELCSWLGSEDQLVAAVAIGYPDEAPPARPRKSIEDVVVWRT